MSGRKKNRKHRHGQPPHELLSELNSLHELLGSDMEADIPLLDQVASPNGSNRPAPPPVLKPVSASTQQPTQQAAPLAPPRPLEEADLPILFSPIDEELTEEYAPTLSDADRELLRPLQDLPRPAGRDEPAPVAKQASPQQFPQAASEARAEFQPGLFDAPRKEVQPQAQSPKSPAPSSTAHASNAAKIQKPVETETGGDVKTAEKVRAAAPPLARAATENPFLPPHIRARLTGGRIPKPEAEVTVSATESQPEAEHTGKAASEDEPGIREQLIEQLMAEQLPELERQLRANITVLVDEIYPEES
ncbi:hypothetical protein [Microbulbifer sp. HZ11]|uniref:hypothetical protein n=1 Tax=Microbulbifer sp. HZ11 TaxID=1453501 RepID=UPI0005BDBEAB|nr:hypothetical protein [Microbulbifer sp. HZ11]